MPADRASNIRQLLRDGVIRVDGNRVASDVPPPQGYDPPAHRQYQAMLGEAYMAAPRTSYDVPDEMYIVKPDYVSGGSKLRHDRREADFDQWGREMEQMRRSGFSPSRTMRMLDTYGRVDTRMPQTLDTAFFGNYQGKPFNDPDEFKNIMGIQK